MTPEEFIKFSKPFPDPICMLTANGKILAANDATSRFLEKDLIEIHNKTLLDLVTDDENKVIQNLRNWSRSREMIPGPLNIRINDHEVRPCNCSGSLLQPKTETEPATILVRFQRRNQFSKSFTVLNNKIAQLQKEIDVRQRTEHALAKSKAEFVAMFNSIPDAVMFTDIERRIVINNPAVRTMFGYSDEELRGNLSEMLYADKADYLDQGRRRYSINKASDHGAYEVRYKRKDGSIFWSETLGTQVKNTEGETIGFIGLIRDITERKKTEEEIDKYRNHLEALVKERTIALENSNKELESYSYSIAHDLRSPLRAITSFSQILLEDATEKLDEIEKDHLNRVIKSAQHMAKLIDDILELSRVSRSEIQCEKVDLSGICSDISAAIQVSQPDRKVEWRIQPGLTIHGDYHLMYTVLNNLLGNAWKFTQYQNKTIIEFGQLEQNGEKVFFIRDNGVGFDMNHANKLFGLFQRLHRQDEYEGTGVGLATVQRIIERHFGWIKAEGEINKGASIYFSIPEKPVSSK